MELEMQIALPEYVVNVSRFRQRLFIDVDPDVGIPMWSKHLGYGAAPKTQSQLETCKRCMVLESRERVNHSADVRILKGTVKNGKSIWHDSFFKPSIDDGWAAGFGIYRAHRRILAPVIDVAHAR